MEYDILFREILTTGARSRLSGEILVAIPIAWHIIGIFICSIISVVALFLSLGSYSRVETVSGVVTPDTGLSAVVPSRAGVITSIDVHDGQIVVAGSALASVRSEEAGAASLSSAAQVEAAIARQDAGLAAQSAAAGAATQAQISQLAAQRSGLLSEIGQIRAQIALQNTLISSAQRDFDRAQVVADKGFISVRDLQQREETLLARRQGLSQLTQALTAKQASISESERNAVQVSAQSRAQSASLAASRAQVAREAASASGSRSYVLRAPIAGRVTALTARVGQPASALTPLMTIVPSDSVLRAELAIPSSAIGFIKNGQEVRLAVDAFPYQRFGTVTGKVVTVAATSISAAGPAGTAVAVYPVTVSLAQSGVLAYGRREPLISGMSLTARIVTERQTLLEWLFEPLFAVRRR